MCPLTDRWSVCILNLLTNRPTVCIWGGKEKFVRSIGGALRELHFKGEYKSMSPRFNPFARISMAIVAYFVSMFAFLGVLAVMDQLERVRTEYAFLASMNVLVGLWLTAAVFAAYKLLDRGRPFRLGFAVRRKDLAFAAAAVTASMTTAIVFAFAAASREPGLGTVFRLEKLGDTAFLGAAAYGFLGWLIASMQEEVLNRGYMFANLHRLRPLGMLLAASFLFALTHIPTKGLHMYPLLIHFIGGLCYGYVYLKSGSLWISSAVHAAHNWALDLWFNDDYGVSLVSFAVPLTDGTKLLQQALLVFLILVLTYGFYGRNGIWTPADNLNALWTADRHRPHPHRGGIRQGSAASADTAL